MPKGARVKRPWRKPVVIWFDPTHLAVIRAEAIRRASEGTGRRVTMSEVVEDMVAYWMRTEGR